MLTPCFNGNYRKIMILAVAAVAGLATINFATSEGRATYDVAASQSRPATPMTNCNAKASKLLQLMDAAAPVIH
jgi:hypothetical protein